MTTAALYARVSTQRQAEEATIASQIAQLEVYAQANKYIIPPEHHFMDEAVSGKGLHRPGLTRLRDTAMTGAFTTILCPSPDRLSRNLGIQQFLLDEWRRLNIDLVFINRPSLAESAHDALLLNIEGAFAEYERTVISDRMQRGRRHRLRQGESAPYPAPYGYLYWSTAAHRGSRWEVDEAQALIVRQVFLWYTQDSVSIYEIAKRLNQQRVPAPGGERWYRNAVRRLLCQPAYKGTAYYARTQRDDSGIGLPRKQGNGRLQYPRYKPRPVEEWIEVVVPSLVEKSLWQQAQETRQMNARISTRNSRRSYLLRGLLICGVCGSILQGRTQNENSYYRCPHGGKHRAPTVAVHTCSIRADVVESQVWQALADLLHHPERIQDAWTAHRESVAQPPSQVTRWQQRQKHLKNQRRRLMDAYQSEQLSLEELTERQNPLQIELRELATRLATTQQVDAVDISLEQFTTQIEHALHSTDVKTKQEVIRLLIERIVVEENALIIEHIIPTTDNSRLEPTQCVAWCVLRGAYCP